MIFDYETKIIQMKLVYYGCAMSGKTTTLKNLFKSFSLEDRLTSIETTTGRTLFFDYGVISFQGGEWTIKIGIYSATGQDFYAATRPATLTGADGIFFIIDSQKKFYQDNLQSWRELIRFYKQKIETIPIIFCLNKQDLENLVDYNSIIRDFKLDLLPKSDLIKTSAINGEGTLEAFKKMLGFLFPSIHIR